MKSHEWPLLFKKTYDHGIQKYSKGVRGADEVFSPKEKQFLDTIGCSTQELYDFVEDAVNYGEPSYESALLITAVRRDYFWVVQKGVRSHKVVPMEALPPKALEVDGIAWLPRLIAKARIKLRGEMNPDLMYGCGGDRPFAAENNFDLADFLRVVWMAGDDDKRVIHWVKVSRQKGSGEGFKAL